MRRRVFQPPALLVASALAMFVLAASAGRAALVADAADDERAYPPGLVARYTGADGATVVRLEEDLAMALGERPPDPRVLPGPWSARYLGRLWVQTPGTYRLRVFTTGSVRLTLAGKLLIDDWSTEDTWLDGRPIELDFGYHPLEIDYLRGIEPARLALFWEGPGFRLEPVASRWLFHDREQTPSPDFDAGARLARALRCAACHDVPGAAALPAPALHSLSGNLSKSWFVERLTSRGASEPPDGRRMPHFAFDRATAAAVSDYLWSISEPLPKQAAVPAAAPAPATANDKAATENLPPSVAQGRTLFHSLGCLACHRVASVGTDGPFGGGDLSHVAAKRPAEFFARWLADPGSLNRDHRMPVFALSGPEIESLSLYLRSLQAKPAPEASLPASTDASIALGKLTVNESHCAACHALPKAAEAPAAKRTKLSTAALARETDNCLAAPDPAKRRPGYALDAAARRAITAYLAPGAGRFRAPAPKQLDGREVLAERNCLGCHARGSSAGLAAQLPAITEAEPALRAVVSALAPPALDGVGDKLRDETLAASILGGQPARRPWLRVRMPKFALDKPESEAVARYLIGHDRIPPRPEPKPAAAPPKDRSSSVTPDATADRLVTARGFGCTSCHAIGAWQPRGVALNAAGSDLAEIGARVRQEWFDRWVRNPARIVPHMEMPAVTQPIRGVLDANLELQLASVWQVLNRPGFAPPDPGALRVVRRGDNAPGSEPAAVLTDAIEIDGRPWANPLVIGLSNRHNVLVDLATARLAAWWVGDTASQHTRGKTWYWESDGTQLLPAADGSSADIGSDVLLADAARTLDPTTDGDYLTQFDALEHDGAAVDFSYRLRFPTAAGPTTLRVAQHFAPLEAHVTDGAGFVRRLQIDHVPPGHAVEFLALAGEATLEAGGRRARLGGRGADLSVELIAPAEATFAKTPRGATLRLTAAQAKTCEVAYRTSATAERAAPLAQSESAVARQALNVVPGFDAVRLPLSDRPMPTGLAWRRDGTLVVSSLEGRVWLARDTDGDGLEDHIAPFSDELAAPYGVAVTVLPGGAGEAIDVINKYGLLRLTDRDGDGRADRTELIAAGWGHTLDYHDWAVGLPRDAQGNYYVALPCQQDKRSAAGAALRGAVIKLAPRTPSADNPLRYAIEPLAAGLRFPHGIATSPAGDVFVTDNQGNYTPFNELNHVVAGARYGFINRLENKPGFDPPFRSAAIEIPHPWTRSVNGICFLTPPAPAGQSQSRLYGPLAGQIVGCEYDTRQLVRMSLERVAGEFQGAVYPLSIEPAVGGETFEGPLVCQLAPNGDLYVGNIRDSGWGAGTNTGSIVRLRWKGNLPPGIAQVRAAPGGFAIEFTAPVDRVRAGQPGSYAVSSYRRTPTPDYGGPDQLRRVETVRSVTVAPDGRAAILELAELREGFVYEFHLRNLTSEPLFFPAEAYYTLRHKRS